jgi:hypothetical protein
LSLAGFESAWLSVGFDDSDEVVALASAPSALSALSAIATPAPATSAAATPAVTIPAPSHTKNRSTMTTPFNDRVKR